jgi:TnpA family transposase
MTEWHLRYGGRGVMIYLHVEKKSICIYSQLKTCSLTTSCKSNDELELSGLDEPG